MRIGTFKCWLWGHKFIAHVNDIWEEGVHYWEEKPTDYCVRCGIKKLLK